MTKDRQTDNDDFIAPSVGQVSKKVYLEINFYKLVWIRWLEHWNHYTKKDQYLQ